VDIRPRVVDVALAVGHADAGWGEELVAGEDKEIAVVRLHVDAGVGDGLGPHYHHSRWTFATMADRDQPTTQRVFYCQSNLRQIAMAVRAPTRSQIA